MRRFYQCLLSVGGVGFIPYAAGTWGTVVGGVIWWLLRGEGGVMVGLCLVVGVLGLWARVKLRTVSVDPSWIVLDEVLGFWVSLFVVESVMGQAVSVEMILVTGLAFRFFDIVKPFPIRWVEEWGSLKWRSIIGVFADDVVAGVIAGIVVVVASKLWI